MCRSGPLDTLTIFTTTISVSNMYSTNIVVIDLIIWLYITVVVVVISFSIIASCIFITLLLVTVGIIYSKTGSSIDAVIIILFDGENISFEASLVMYIKSTNIPRIMIMNRMYENQNLPYIVSLTQHNTRHIPTVRRTLSTVRLTQYDMLPQHQVNIRKSISECF